MIQKLSDNERETLRRRQMLYNVMTSRAQLMQNLFDERRDIDVECGYPKELTINHYKYLYEREGIATRVVTLWPTECWQQPPRVYETEDATTTAFEDAFDELGKTLAGQSWMVDRETNVIWHYLQRLDDVAGIGQFGAMLIGFSDGDDLMKPVTPGEGLTVNFLRPFDQSMIEITEINDDSSDRRYGWPEQYELQIVDPKNLKTGVYSTKGQKVHWSRILHFADNTTISDVLGTPRMQTVFNRLYDLRKLLGGSAEMFWKGAFPGYSFEVDPELGDIDMDSEAVKEEFAAYADGLQRYMALSGVSAKSLAPQVADPGQHIDAQLQAVALTIGVPQRVFLGSEQAQLASGQDSRRWNGRLTRRNNSTLTPKMLAPLIDRFIEFKVLPEPKEYFIEWPDLDAPTDMDKVEMGAKFTEAIAKYSAAGGQTIVPETEWLVHVMGLPQDLAESIVEAATEAIEEEERELERAMEAQEQIMAKREADELMGGGDDDEQGNQGGNGNN